ncbi:hypothetical protein EC970259_A0104 [Escherichia coli 99.0741]|uniref:Uncharacterized protein n=1 Tax=Escherichia coli ACN001 TaxID=1311757 RepID=A0A140WYP3_ECOLX|nr:hypothetical protein J444_pB176 [Escherichia coli ACN001]EIH42133.1 hypothetical protein EC970259_A0104 [Escherichia coli 99.0741]
MPLTRHQNNKTSIKCICKSMSNTDLLTGPFRGIFKTC